MKTVIDLFVNYSSLTPFPYLECLVKTSSPCAFMTSSSWFVFHEDVIKIKHYLDKKLSPKLY